MSDDIDGQPEGGEDDGAGGRRFDYEFASRRKGSAINPWQVQPGRTRRGDDEADDDDTYEEIER